MLLHEMSADEQLREMDRLREKAILDEQLVMNFVRNEGRTKERETVIFRICKDGLTEEQMQRYVKQVHCEPPK